MKVWGTEVISPTCSFLSNTTSSWLLEHSSSRTWSAEENKLFENALAFVECVTPDLWEKMAAMFPGKTTADIINHYQDLEDDVIHIEAGLVPVPGYTSSSFTLDWENDSGTFDSLKQAYGGKRSGGRISDQERKKGVPWTEQEHRLFLMGLKKYGKGDWRNISRNFVTSRTPTQVASHAQKYFIRLSSGGKDKRRSSIHDITTVNLPDSMPLSPSQVPVQSCSSATHLANSGNNTDEAASAFNQTPLSSLSIPSYTCYGLSPYETKLLAQNSHASSAHDSVVARAYFQMQSACLSNLA